MIDSLRCPKPTPAGGIRPDAVGVGSAMHQRRGHPPRGLFERPGGAHVALHHSRDTAHPTRTMAERKATMDCISAKLNAATPPSTAAAR